MVEDEIQYAYFGGTQSNFWTKNRHYRLYMTSNEIIAIWVGNDEVPSFVGGLLGTLMALALSKGKKKKTRDEELATKTLDEMRADHKHNYALSLEEIESAELLPSSLLVQMNYASIKPVGVLSITCYNGKRLEFGIWSKEDMEAAIDLPTSHLADRTRIKTTWDERKKQYVQMAVDG